MKSSQHTNNEDGKKNLQRTVIIKTQTSLTTSHPHSRPHTGFLQHPEGTTPKEGIMGRTAREIK